MKKMLVVLLLVFVSFSVAAQDNHAIDCSHSWDECEMITDRLIEIHCNKCDLFETVNLDDPIYEGVIDYVCLKGKLKVYNNCIVYEFPMDELENLTYEQDTFVWSVTYAFMQEDADYCLPDYYLALEYFPHNVFISNGYWFLDSYLEEVNETIKEFYKELFGL